MLLRPRQKTFVSKTLEALYTHGNTLAVAPTGAGKTIMLSAVIGRMFEHGDTSRACVVAHRDELTDQNIDKFKQVNPSLSTSIFNAGRKSWNGQVSFAMVQTLSRKNNLHSLPSLDVLVIDEAHHARADSYMRVIRHARRVNPKVKLLGMTATPNRGDKKGLRPVFSNVSDQISVTELVVTGHLVPPRTTVINVGVQDELRGVRKTAFDYDMGAVADIMNKQSVNDEVIRHWKEKAYDRQTVVFCSTVNHADDVVTCFRAAGIKADMIWGDMKNDDRKATLNSYGMGKIQVIVNVAVLTEGWDHPPTSCIVLLRPSSHKSTMIQMIGRGLRTVDPNEYPGVVKKDCLVLDFGTSTLTHGSLEQEIEFDDQIGEGQAPYKSCPECDANVPAATLECPLCGYVWDRETQPAETSAESETIEIDLLERSNFLWCDLRDDDQYFIATGFNAWGGVFLFEEEWYAVGGRKNKGVQLLATGERTVCFAAADDWTNLYENESTAHKSRKWLHLPATEKQLQILKPHYRGNKNLTRYKASALITMQDHTKNIRRVIEIARNTSN